MRLWLADLATLADLYSCGGFAALGSPSLMRSLLKNLAVSTGIGHPPG